MTPEQEEVIRKYARHNWSERKEHIGPEAIQYLIILLAAFGRMKAENEHMRFESKSRIYQLEMAANDLEQIRKQSQEIGRLRSALERISRPQNNSYPAWLIARGALEGKDE